MGWLNIKPDEINVESRSLDTLHWSRLAENNEGLRKIMPLRQDKVIGADLYRSLFEIAPTIKDEPVDTALAAWLQEHLEEPEIKKLREETMGNKNLSAAGAMRLHKELLRRRESDYKRVTEIRKNQETISNLYRDAETGKLDPAGEVAMQAIKEAQQQLADKIREHREQAKASTPGSGKPVGNDETQAGMELEAVKESMANVTQDIQAATEMAAFDGGMSRGMSLDNSSSERVLQQLADEDLIGRVTTQDRLRQIFRVAGRMRMILEQAKAESPMPTPPPIGVTIGDDLPSVLPHQFAYLGVPGLEEMFWSKYIDRSLLQFERDSQDNMGQGPFICMMDLSGSMSGQPAIYAFALFTALARMAVEAGRTVYWIPFASNAGRAHKIDSSSALMNIIDPRAVTAAPKRRSSRRKVALDFDGREIISGNSPMTTENIGNGTNFDAAWERGLQTLETEQLKDKADFLFLTDGYGRTHQHFVDEINKVKENNGLRVYGVMLNGYWESDTKQLLDATTEIQNTGLLSKLEWLKDAAVGVV